MNRSDSWTRAIAVVAVCATLLVGGANWWNANRQIDLARETAKVQIDGLQKQIGLMQEQGPVLTADADLAIFQPDAGKWEDLDPKTMVSSKTMETGNLVLRIRVTNSGRYKATITGVGVGTGTNTFQPAEGPNCSLGKDVSPCKMPISLEPQTEQWIFVDLEHDELRQALTCSEYNRKELEYVVNTIGAAAIAERLPSSVYYVNDGC